MLDDQAFFDEARTFLKDRRRRVLFVGGDPTDMVLEYVDAERFVSVCNPTPEAATRLRAALAKRKAERMVTLDSRSYAEITFEMSAFDGIVMAEMGPGIPNAKVLLKKVKHDLKMGARFITQISIRRNQSASPLVVRGLRLLDRVAAALPTDQLRAAEEGERWCRHELMTFVEKYLKVHELRYMGAFPIPPTERLPAPLAKVMAITLGKPSLAEAMARVPGWVPGCTSVLLKLANENDFGSVFTKHMKEKA